MKLRTPSMLVMLVLAAGLTGCYEPESHIVQTVDETWPADGVTTLDLESLNGRVDVRATGDDQIVIRAEVRSSHKSNDEVVRFAVESGILEVREKWPRAKGFLPFGRSSGGSVRYEIEVPERCELELETTNGRLETHGVRGRQSLTSVNGRIEIDTPDALIEAETVNGRIEARFHEAFRGAELATVNGSVKVYVPSGTQVAADVDQVNGSFNSRLPVVVNASGAEGMPLRVSTVNGSVTLDQIGSSPE